MRSRDVIFWEVDCQADFMLPGGKLYVPGAEKLLPNIRRLTNAAREGKAFLVSHGCFHTPDDPEFKQFPPHCVQGTPGAELVPEAVTTSVARVPNSAECQLPSDLQKYQQILLEKQTLNIFETHHAADLVEQLGSSPEFIVFGVTTEFCVRLAAKGLLERGRRVSIVKDTVEALKPEDGVRAISELRALGAQIINTDQALAKLEG
jgi:nicotinamidase/pyrazinamidase